MEPLHRLLKEVEYRILSCQRCEASYIAGGLSAGVRVELGQHLAKLSEIVRSTDFALALSSVRHRKLRELVLNLDVALRRIPASADEPDLVFRAISPAQEMVQAIYALEEKVIVG